MCNSWDFLCLLCLTVHGRLPKAHGFKRGLGSDHPFFLAPPLSVTNGENDVQITSTNQFSVTFNIRFEFFAVRELAQKVEGEVATEE